MKLISGYGTPLLNGCTFAVLLSAWLCPAAESASRSLAIALLQLHPQTNNQAANLQIADSACRDAARRGADIALLPEMWNMGYTRFDPARKGAKEDFWTWAVSKEDSFVRHFASLAKELRMAIAVTYAQKWSPTPRNVMTLFDRNGIEVFTYAKVHTCDFKPLETAMTPGEEFYTGILDTQHGPVRVGAMICFDREQPESARILMLKGAELVLTPNACKLDDRRIQQFRIRAWENVFAVAMANYPKPNHNGHSVAFDGSGNCLVEADEADGIYIAKLDLDELKKLRAKSIHGNAYRRPHRYKPLVSPEQEPVWKRMDGEGKEWQQSQR